MNNGNFWYKWYPEKFNKDTRLLSFDQRSLYWALIDLLYTESGLLPNDSETLASVFKIDIKRFEKLFEPIKKFFIITNESISHKKVKVELAKQDISSETQSNAGKIGAAIKYIKKELNLTKDQSDSLKSKLYKKYDKVTIEGFDKLTLRKALKGIASHIYNSSSNSSSNSVNSSNSLEGGAGENSDAQIFDIHDDETEVELWKFYLETTQTEYSFSTYQREFAQAISTYGEEKIRKVIEMKAFQANSNKSDYKRTWLAPSTLFEPKKLEKYVNEVKDYEAGRNSSEKRLTKADILAQNNEKLRILKENGY